MIADKLQAEIDTLEARHRALLAQLDSVEAQMAALRAALREAESPAPDPEG